MLVQKSRIVLRAVSGLPVPVKPPQYGSFLALFKSQVRVRQWSTTTIIPFAYAPITPKLPPRIIDGIGLRSTRCFSTTRVLKQEANATESTSKPLEQSKPLTPEETPFEFKRTEKGEAAKAVDLSARLKDRSSQSEKGEVTRLLKLAGREWRALTRTHSPLFG